MFKKEFDTSFVGFMKDGAKWLVDNTDIKLVGKIQIDFDKFLSHFKPFCYVESCINVG